MSKKTTRLARLKEVVADRKILHIKDAAALLEVSEMTVRRDVRDNPTLFAFLGGHIVSVGEGSPDAPYELAKASDAHASAKRLACEHAAKYIRDGDTIFIDCGSTLTYLVDLIPDDFKITAVCYAMNIAERLMRKPNVSMILLGGLFHPSSASFSGDPGLETVKHIGINVAFLSAAGVDLDRGVTCAQFHEAPVKKAVIAIAQRRYLIADNSKMGVQKPAFFASMDVFNALITEDGAIDLSV
jgi:DeoR family deoxyribose operon repressor